MRLNGELCGADSKAKEERSGDCGTSGRASLENTGTQVTGDRYLDKINRNLNVSSTFDMQFERGYDQEGPKDQKGRPLRSNTTVVPEWARVHKARKGFSG